MKIQLNQTNIVEGIKMYIQSQGINLDGRDIQVVFTAGRSRSGMTADVDIEDNSAIGYTAPQESVAEAPVHTERLQEAVVEQEEETADEGTATLSEPQEETLDATSTTTGNSLFS